MPIGSGCLFLPSGYKLLVVCCKFSAYSEPMIIDGKQIAEEILAELQSARKIKKTLHAIVVGKDPASLSFLKQKETIAKRLEIAFELHGYPERIREEDLRREIADIAGKKSCGGLIIQLPLPTHLNAQYLLNSIPREIDVDVLSERALGAFYTGRGKILPPSVSTLLAVLDRNLIHARGDDASVAGWFIEHKKIAVVGLGSLVGKPIGTWLLGKSSEIHYLDVGSNLSELKHMDIVIIGVGRAGLVKASMLKADALVVDFGYRAGKHGIAGDFDAKGAPDTLAYTPTPGGTGPILVAQLFKNFYALNS